MKASELTYFQFISLPDDKRMETQEAFIVASCSFESVIDCLMWSWRDVKETQAVIDEDLSYLQILDIVKRESKKINEHSSAVVVFRMFNEIKKQIQKITEGEANALSGEMSVKEKLAAVAVGGFDEFGTIPQTLTLCKLFNMPYERVELMPYHICFMALYYDKRIGDFNTELTKQT